MNRFLTNLIKDKERLFFYLDNIIEYICSVLSLRIANDFGICSISLAIFMAFRICERECTDIYLKKIINTN